MRVLKRSLFVGMLCVSSLCMPFGHVMASENELTKEHMYYMQSIAITTYCSVVHNLSSAEIEAIVLKQLVFVGEPNVVEDVLATMPDNHEELTNALVGHLVDTGVIIDCRASIENLQRATPSMR